MFVAVIVLAILCYLFIGCAALQKWNEANRPSLLEIVMSLTIWPIVWFVHSAVA